MIGATKKPALVWIAEGANKVTVGGLFRFARHAWSNDCVVVLPPKRQKRWKRRVIRWLRRFALIRTTTLQDEVNFFYTHADRAANEASVKVAAALVADIRPWAARLYAGAFSEQEIDWLMSAVRLALSDMVYAEVRRSLVLAAQFGGQSDVPLGFFWKGKRISTTSENAMVEFALPKELSSLAPVFDLTGVEGLGSSVDTLIIGSVNRSHYVDAAMFLSRGETELDRSSALLLQVDPLRSGLKDYFLRRITIPFFYATRKSRRKVPNPEGLGIPVSIDPAPFRQLGEVGDLAYHAVRFALTSRFSETVARILAHYLKVRAVEQLQGVDMVFASPSRSPINLPVLALMRSRGAKVVEYQAFFWSSHPRYEVRDLDLFVCSDKATMEVVKEKYRALGSDTPVVLGPSFALAEFLDRFRQAMTARGDGARDRFDIGVALQPTAIALFDDTCARLAQAGHRLLIRPHPSMERDKTEARFSRYGKIDSGTLEDFLLDSRVIVTGFSNVAVQATACGRPVVCLPQPDGVGLDLAAAADGALICQTMEDLLPLVDSVQGRPFNPPTESALDQWMKIRRDLDAGVYDRPGRRTVQG